MCGCVCVIERGRGVEGRHSLQIEFEGGKAISALALNT